MASFASDIMDSTRSKQLEDEKAQAAFQRNIQKMQEQFGVQQRAGTPKIYAGTPGGYQSAETQSKILEADRRKKAAEDAYSLGKQIDTRKGSLTAQVDAAIKARKNIQDKAAAQQRQQDAEFNFANEQTYGNAKQKLGEMNFSLYKSDNDRRQAMREAFAKGTLEKQLMDAANNNALKQQDIDNYFKMLKAQIEADFNAAKKGSEWDFEMFKLNMERRAQNTASIISGITGVAETAPAAYEKFSDAKEKYDAQTAQAPVG